MSTVELGLRVGLRVLKARIRNRVMTNAGVEVMSKAGVKDGNRFWVRRLDMELG